MGLQSDGAMCQSQSTSPSCFSPRARTVFKSRFRFLVVMLICFSTSWIGRLKGQVITIPPKLPAVRIRLSIPERRMEA
jgi:hypothetical protein